MANTAEDSEDDAMYEELDLDAAIASATETERKFGSQASVRAPSHFQNASRALHRPPLPPKSIPSVRTPSPGPGQAFLPTPVSLANHRTSLLPAVNAPSIPARKRPRISDYKPDLGLPGEVDENPAIFVREDGTYGIANQNVTMNPATRPLERARIPEAPPSGFAGRAFNDSRHANRTSFASLSIQGQSQPPALRRIVHNPLRFTGIGSGNDEKPHIAGEDSVTARNGSRPGFSPGWQAEMQAMKRQLAELTIARDRAEKASKEAEEARFAKEGEASTLRRNMEKLNSTHKEAILRMKAERQALEERMVEMERRVKEEKEQLASRFAFRQQELETSARKPPWSASRNRSKAGPSTPLPQTTPIRNSRAGPVASQTRATSSQDPFLPGPDPQMAPAIRPVPNVTQRPRRTDKDAAQPAFPKLFNSFQQTSPILDRKTRKGKERATEPDRPTIEPFQLSIPAEGDISYPDDSMDVDRSPTKPVPTVDVLGPESITDSYSEGPTLKERLHYIVYSHATPPGSQLTLQVLLGTAIPPDSPQETRTEYTNACAAILEGLGPRGRDEWHDIVCIVGQPLVQIAGVLKTINAIQELVKLFDLMTALSLSLPGFTGFFLSGDNDRNPPSLILFICGVIRDLLVPPPQGHPKNQNEEPLARSTLNLLESFCCCTPEDCVPRLGMLLHYPRVLANLLNPSQPNWMVWRTMRLLTLIASYPTLFRNFISPPDLNSQGVKESAPDLTRLPLIETLCPYLLEPVVTTDQGVRSLHEPILTLLSSLAVMHQDVPPVLVESHSLVPSLVLCLYNTTSSIWEDDEKIMSCPDSTATYVRRVRQIVQLLHYLAFKPQPPPNLLHRLQSSAQTTYNGLLQIYVVTLGRVSFADPPEWMNPTAAGELERLADLARGLLECVLGEGPEMDMAWEVYQGSDSDNKTDDEEMEARQMQTDEDE